MWSGGLAAQIPATELYLFDLTRDATNTWHAHSPKLLSTFNAGGYTNQPEFIEDNLLYVSVRKEGDSQNDIYALSLADNSITRVTATPANEFSPLKHPDGMSFTCVRQVEGDEMDQRIFKYPLDRSNTGEPVNSDLVNVGYHCWLNESVLATFLVEEPPTLGIVSVESGSTRKLASSIGRSLRRMTDGRLAFVHKYTDEYWYLKSMDSHAAKSTIIIETPDGAEDFIVDGEDNFFIGSGSKLYVLDRLARDKWTEVADLSVFGVQRITRLAINGRSQLAVVSVPFE